MKPESKKAVDEIIDVPKKPDIKVSAIMENKNRRKKSTLEFIQYRVLIPKRFAKMIKINVEKEVMVFYLYTEGKPKNPSYKLTAELMDKKKAEELEKNG
jgi:hypothetical protein